MLYDHESQERTIGYLRKIVIALTLVTMALAGVVFHNFVSGVWSLLEARLTHIERTDDGK